MIQTDIRNTNVQPALKLSHDAIKTALMLQDPDGNTVLHKSEITPSTLTQLEQLEETELFELLNIKNNDGITPIHHSYIDMRDEPNSFLRLIAKSLSAWNLAHVFHHYFYEGNAKQYPASEEIKAHSWESFTCLLDWSKWDRQSFVFKENRLNPDEFQTRYYDFRWFANNPLTFRMIKPRDLDYSIPGAKKFFASRTSDDKTPLHFPDTIDVYYSYAYSKMEVNDGALSQTDWNGNTPMHNPKVAKVMLPIVLYQVHSGPGAPIRKIVLDLFCQRNHNNKTIWHEYWDDTCEKILDIYPLSRLIDCLLADPHGFVDESLPDNGLINYMTKRLEIGLSTSSQREWISKAKTISGNEPFVDVVKRLPPPLDSLTGDELIYTLFDLPKLERKFERKSQWLLAHFIGGEFDHVSASQWTELLCHRDERGNTPLVQFNPKCYPYVRYTEIHQILHKLSDEQLLTVFNAPLHSRGNKSHLESFVPVMVKRFDADRLYEILLQATPLELEAQDRYHIPSWYEKTPHTLLKEILSPDQMNRLSC